MWVGTFCVVVAEGGFAHVGEFDCAFAGAVGKVIAMYGMEFSSCNHLCQLLHIHRFNIHDVYINHFFLGRLVLKD